MLLKRKKLKFLKKIIVFLVNLIILLINLILIFKQTDIKNKEIFKKDIKKILKLKNADNFLYFIFKKYQQISNYLNEKYNNKLH
jgi:uncharacterized membrane protein